MSIEMKNEFVSVIDNIYESKNKDGSTNFYYCTSNKKPIAKVKVLNIGDGIRMISNSEYDEGYPDDSIKYYLYKLIDAVITLSGANYASCSVNDKIFDECLMHRNFIRVTTGDPNITPVAYTYYLSSARPGIFNEENDMEVKEEEKEIKDKDNEFLGIPIVRLPGSFDIYGINPRVTENGEKCFTIVGINDTNHDNVCQADLIYDDMGFVHTMKNIQVSPKYDGRKDMNNLKTLISYCINTYGMSKIFYKDTTNNTEVLYLLNNSRYTYTDMNTGLYIRVNPYSNEFEPIDTNVFGLKRIFTTSHNDMESDERHITAFIVVPNTTKIACEAMVSSSVLTLDNASNRIEIGDSTISHIKEYPGYEGKGYDIALVNSLVKVYPIKKIIRNNPSKTFIELCIEKGFASDHIADDKLIGLVGLIGTVVFSKKENTDEIPTNPESYTFIDKDIYTAISNPYLRSTDEDKCVKTQSISIAKRLSTDVALLCYPTEDSNDPDSLITLEKIYSCGEFPTVIVESCVKHFPSIIDIYIRDDEETRAYLRKIGYVYVGDDHYVREDALISGKVEDKEIIPNDEFVSFAVMNILEKDIKEINGIISNESLWEKGYDGEEPNPHTQNIANWKAVLKAFENIVYTI